MLLLINFIRKLISTVYGISYNILYTIAIYGRVKYAST